MTGSARRTVSPTVSKAPWKPRVFDKPVPFFGSSNHQNILIGIQGVGQTGFVGNNRRPTIKLPYDPFPTSSSCPIESLDRLHIHDYEEIRDQINLSYDVVGGSDANALRVYWTVSEKTYTPCWIALKTFTGLQVKYVLPHKRPPIIFALADEDAYTYCSEDPCTTCTFRCKRGFEAYVYIDRIGVVTLPIHEETIAE